MRDIQQTGAVLPILGNAIASKGEITKTALGFAPMVTHWGVGRRRGRRSNSIQAFSVVLWVWVLSWALLPEGELYAQLNDAQVQKILRSIDQRQKVPGDYKATVVIDQKGRKELNSIFQSVIYRRDTEDQFLILFTKPRSEAGKGYLRIDRNLFMYDPTVGKWERRTERDRLMGTDTRRADLDEWNLEAQYVGRFVADATLGRFAVHHLRLSAKENKRVPYPTVEIWVDKKTLNILKRQDFSLSGRLLRTSYYPKWSEVRSPTGEVVAYPVEMRIFDEVDKERRTTVVVFELRLDHLNPNIFTKAWLESRSR